MKKLLAALLIATTMVLGACGGDEESTPADEPVAEEPAVEEPAEDEASGVDPELAGALTNVATGIEVYFTDNMEYPSALSELDDATINQIPQGVTMDYYGGGDVYCLQAVADDGSAARYESGSDGPVEGTCPT